MKKLLSFFGLVLLLSGCVHEVKQGGKTVSNPSRDRAFMSYIELARGYLAKGEPQKALAAAGRADEYQSGRAETYEVRALAYGATGERRLAGENFRKALMEAPGNAGIHNNYAAWLALSEKDLAGAKKHFLLASQDPAFIQRGRVFENLGRIVQMQGNAAEAEGYYQQAVRIDDRLFWSYQQLADFSYRKGQFRDAQRYYNQMGALVTQKTPEQLALGVRIARANKDAGRAYSYMLELKNQHGDSQAYQQLSQVN
jgi:type IV pilus assembly protein PilF